MNTNMIEEILRLKKEKNTVVLAHNYQPKKIQEIADFAGDSLGLARKAQQVNAEKILMCGVDFMAETASILNPDKKVFIPSLEANCPMAAQLKPEEITKAKEKYPDARIVLYVNTSAKCKALADACCTSANAADIVNAMDSETVIFGPDNNLGWFVKQRSSKKLVDIPSMGYCYAHRKIMEEEVLAQKEKHPEALVLAHPECNPEVQKLADRIESTSGMLNVAGEEKAKEFIIATEKEMLYRLGKENPGKKFYAASENAVCGAMKKINLENVLESLREEKHEVKVPEEIAEPARKAIEKMLEI